MNVPPMEPIKSQDKSDINEERNMVNEIDCSRPQDYTYSGKNIVHIWQKPSSVDYLIAYDCGNNVLGNAWAVGAEIIKKPQFKPEVGKWYWLEEDTCITYFSQTDSDCGLEDKFKPIPQSIKDRMVFEGE